MSVLHLTDAQVARLPGRLPEAPGAPGIGPVRLRFDPRQKRHGKHCVT